MITLSLYGFTFVVMTEIASEDADDLTLDLIRAIIMPHATGIQLQPAFAIAGEMISRLGATIVTAPELEFDRANDY